MHEADSENFISLILDRHRGLVSRREISSYLLKRDRKLRLEIDSSQLNYFVLPELVELFPEGKFILTIRDCFSWVDSFINHTLAREATDMWLALRDQRFGSRSEQFPEEETPLAEKGLYTLAGYLKYWTKHNQAVIDSVPAERLLVIRTHEISTRSEEIAAFVDLPYHALEKKNSHSFKNPDKFNLLSKLPESYVRQCAMEHCSDLMSRYFPGVKYVSKRDL